MTSGVGPSRHLAAMQPSVGFGPKQTLSHALRTGFTSTRPNWWGRRKRAFAHLALLRKTPVGQIRTTDRVRQCPALPPKIFRLTRRANQRYDSAHLTRSEGRCDPTQPAVGCAGPYG